MIARGTATRTLRQCVCMRRPRVHNLQIARRYSSATSSPQLPGSVAKVHPLAAVTSQIDRVAPRFEIDASQIEIIDSPTAFYATLKVTRDVARAWDIC